MAFPFLHTLCAVERGDWGWSLQRLLLRPPLAAVSQKVEGKCEADRGVDAAGDTTHSTPSCQILCIFLATDTYPNPNPNSKFESRMSREGGMRRGGFLAYLLTLWSFTPFLVSFY